MASFEAGGQAVKREIEAVFAGGKDGGRVAAERLRAMRQRVLEAPRLNTSKDTAIPDGTGKASRLLPAEA